MTQPNRSTFTQLIERLREGSDGAVKEIVDQYGPHVLRVVRRRLHPRLRRRFDSADFLQAVWASFFTHRCRIARFEDPKRLVAFLGEVAANKVRMAHRHCLGTKKANMDREKSLDSVGNKPLASEIQYRETPSQVAVARETWERMLAEQPWHCQRILELRRQGKTYEEIARTLQMNERAVRRIVHRLVMRSKS